MRMHNRFSDLIYFKIKSSKLILNFAWAGKNSNDPIETRPSLPGTFHILIGKFSYFVIRFYYKAIK